MAVGEGVLHYSLDAGVYRLVVDIDPGITDFYRALVPKTVRLNRQKFAPHITVVRETSLPSPARWGAHEGERILFEYNPEIQEGHVYYWLEVYSERMGDIRVELGLPRSGPNTRPPDGAECFHTTLDNLKG